MVRLVLVVFGEGLIEVRYPRMELLFTGEQYIPASKRDRPSEKGLYHFDCVVAADDQFEGGVYRGIIGVFVVGALDIDNDPDLFRYLLPSSDAGFARFRYWLLVARPSGADGGIASPLASPAAVDGEDAALANGGLAVLSSLEQSRDLTRRVV